MLAYSLDLLAGLGTLSREQDVQILLSTKNALVGHRERKVDLLRSGLLHRIVNAVNLLECDDECAITKALHAAAILGTLQTGTATSIYIILVERAHIALLEALSRIIALGPSSSASSSSSSSAVLSSSSSSTPLYDSKYNKLVVTLVRSIKNIFVDLASIFGTHLFGSFGPSDSTKRAGEIYCSHGERTSYAWNEGDPTAIANLAIDFLFRSSPSSPYEPFIPSIATPPSSLDSILLLLIDSRARPGPSLLFHTQISEMICTLLAAVVREADQRVAIQSFLCDREGRHATGALLSLIRWRSGKVQEVALDALSAFITKSPRTAALVQSLVDPHDEDNIDFSDFITSLTRDPRPSLRVSACACLTALWKSSPSTSIKFILPILLALIPESGPLSTAANLTLAHLISGDEVLQAQAIALKILPLLSASASNLPSSTSDHLPSSVIKHYESILLTLAALSETSDAYRRAVSSQQPLLMNLAITSIASPFAPLRLAGLKTLRRLSRSTNVLRTTLVNPKMGPGGKSFVEVLIALTIADKGPDAEPDEEKVTEEALGLLANLLLEFSPLRGPLLEKDCLQSIVARISNAVAADTAALSNGDDLRVKDQVALTNVLWALRNAVYGTSAEFKLSCIQALNGFDSLLSLIERPSHTNEIHLQALCILRNLSCHSPTTTASTATATLAPITAASYNLATFVAASSSGSSTSNNRMDEDVKEQERVTRDDGVGYGASAGVGADEGYNVVFNGIERERFFSMVERMLQLGDDRILKEIIYLLVNIATAGESARRAIVGRANLLDKLLNLLNHEDASIRTGVVWIIVNLTHQRPHTTRSATILTALRALGVESRLGRMMLDPSLDVRERVRDALAAFSVVGR